MSIELHRKNTINFIIMTPEELTIAVIGLIINSCVIITAFIILFVQNRRLKKIRNEKIKLLYNNLVNALINHSEYSKSILEFYESELPLIGIVRIRNSHRYISYKNEWGEWIYRGDGFYFSSPNSEDDFINDIKTFIKEQYNLKV